MSSVTIKTYARAECRTTINYAGLVYKKDASLILLSCAHVAL